MEKGNVSNSGYNMAPVLLGVLFVGLKLTGHIDWPWWLVTLPFWLPVPVFIFAFCFFVVIEWNNSRKK